MRIDVWSDVACPWCYLGKHRIDAALAKFGGKHELVFHAFELDARAPRKYDDGLTHAQRVAAKLRRSPAQIDELHARMLALGQADGIAFDFARVRGGNTFDAHRLIQLGLARGCQPEVKERLMKGYFTEGADLNDADTLVRLATEAGLAAAEAREVVTGKRFTEEVRGDEEAAQELGITGVPFFIVGAKIAVSGAQSIDVLVQALHQAG